MLLIISSKPVMRQMKTGEDSKIKTTQSIELVVVEVKGSLNILLAIMLIYGKIFTS